jgi:hypothetical protein
MIPSRITVKKILALFFGASRCSSMARKGRMAAGDEFVRALEGCKGV